MTREWQSAIDDSLDRLGVRDAVLSHDKHATRVRIVSGRISRADGIITFGLDSRGKAVIAMGRLALLSDETRALYSSHAGDGAYLVSVSESRQNFEVDDRLLIEKLTVSFHGIVERAVSALERALSPNADLWFSSLDSAVEAITHQNLDPRLNTLKISPPGNVNIDSVAAGLVYRQLLALGGHIETWLPTLTSHQLSAAVSAAVHVREKFGIHRLASSSSLRLAVRSLRA